MSHLYGSEVTKLEARLIIYAYRIARKLYGSSRREARELARVAVEMLRERERES